MNGADPLGQAALEALGAIAAQTLLQGSQDAETIKARAWHAFATLQATTGRSSAACASFVGELAKRAVK